VLFRSRDVAQAAVMFTAMAGVAPSGAAAADAVRVGDLLGRAEWTALVAGLVLSVPVADLARDWINRAIEARPQGVRAIAISALDLASVAVFVGLLAVCMMTLAGGTYNPFVYRNF